MKDLLSRAHEDFEKVKADIKQGKNIPHLASATAALLLFSARCVGLLVDPWILPVSVGVLGLLMINSIRHGWILEQMQPKLSGTPIKVYSEWVSEETWAILGTARKSIVLFQSWFPDAAVLADLIRRLARAHSPESPLIVRIYMLDPTDDIGAWRVRELDHSGADRGIEFYREKHGRHYANAFEGFVDRLSNVKTVDLKIYSYSSLPTLKLYVVDEREFLFGWLGAEGPSTNNVCLHVSAESGRSEIESVVTKLQAHRDAVRDRRSRQVWPPCEAQNPYEAPGCQGVEVP